MSDGPVPALRHPASSNQQRSPNTQPPNPPMNTQPSIPIPSPALLRIFTVLLPWLITISTAQADTSAPAFGGTPFNFNGTDYTWDSATESPDPNDASFTLHADLYVDAAGGNQVTVTGRLGTGLAGVSGNAAGFIQGGAFSPDGRYSYRAGGAVLANSGVSYVCDHGWEYYSLNSTTWQLRYAFTSDEYRTYSGGLPGFSTRMDADGYGSFSGNESGVVFNGTFHFNSKANEILASSTYGQNSYGLFGRTYSIRGVEFSLSYSGNTPVLGATEKYVGSGGNLSLRHPDVLNSPASGTFDGNDPIIGGFGGSFNSPETLVFNQGLSAPRFAGDKLWVNSTLMYWASSSILDADGGVADVYSGAMDGNAVTVTVSGNLPAFRRNEDPVNPTTVVEVRSGGVLVFDPPASGSYVKSSPSYFEVPGWYVGDADHSRITPLCLPFTPDLWVNGTRYLFRGGVDDGAGNSVDTYLNPSAGKLVLIGNWTGATHSAVVRMSYQSVAYTGTYDASRSPAEVFDVRDGFDNPMPVAASGPTPPAFWVNGRLYQVSDTDNSSYASASGHSLTTTVSGDTLQLSGEDPVSAFTGTWTTGTAIFRCTRTGNSEGQTIPACPARGDGALMLDAAGASQVLPPAIKVLGTICPYIGTSSEDASPAVSEAYYGHASPGSTGNLLLRIRLDDGTVTLTDFAPSNVTTGTYSATTHLFQSGPGQLPVPIYGTNPCRNNERWGWNAPQNGRPATVLVAGEAWAYTGSDGAGDHYTGYYTGQQITIAHGRDGYGVVTLTMQSGGTLHAGTYYNNAFQMASGPAVASGDKAGTYIAPTGLSLSTTGADLDVLGNLFSLGSLKSNANMVGLTLQFADVDGTAKLYSTLSRPEAEWIWNRADASPTSIAIPMMKLGSGNTLTLFDPWDSTHAPIILNPAGRSRFDGPIRIEPQGDLDMGEFRHGPGEPQ